MNRSEYEFMINDCYYLIENELFSFANKNSKLPTRSLTMAISTTRFAFNSTLKWRKNNKTFDRKKPTKFQQTINNLYIAGYTLSVIALLISLAIFFSFKYAFSMFFHFYLLTFIEQPSRPTPLTAASSLDNSS